MRRTVLGTLLAALAFPVTALAAEPAMVQARTAGAKLDQQQVQRGRYLVKIAGCNDCHTAGYALSGGKVPEAQWLTGDRLGWRGPWGTTYAINLRLYMKDMSETNWVQVAKKLQSRPPMPWFALHDMTEQDLRAIYQYITALGPAGEAAPAYVPPNAEPKGPYVQFPAPPK
jgi:mono/diheme cytochrome c family protein